MLRILLATVIYSGVVVAQTDPGSDQKALSIDEQISQHVQKLADEERKERMDFMAIVIDDIARLCELDDRQRGRLVLAAKGASKRSMERWHEQADRYFRTRVSGADAESAREVLSNIGSVNFSGRGSDSEGELELLWQDSLSNVLSTEQIEEYKSVVASRNQSRIDAIAQMSVVALDNHLRLTPNQKAKLGVIVSQSANTYLDEMQRYWGEYLDRNTLMSLANSVEDEVLASILSTKQLTRLQAATTNLDHFWDQRRQQKAKKANDGNQKDPPEEKKAEGEVGETKAARVRIKGGGDGAVVIQKGAIFRGGAIEFNDGNIDIK